MTTNLEKIKSIKDSAPAAKKIINALAGRERTSRKTDLRQFLYKMANDGVKLSRQDMLDTFMKLENAGLGSLVVGRQNNPDRFRWNYNLKQIFDKTSTATPVAETKVKRGPGRPPKLAQAMAAPKKRGRPAKHAQAVVETKKRGPGRPPKHAASAVVATIVVKKKRGRPPKAASSIAKVSMLAKKRGRPPKALSAGLPDTDSLAKVLSRIRLTKRAAKNLAVLLESIAS